MKYILKNAETKRIDDVYGYYRYDNFYQVTPNGDGTYTDITYNRKFFGSGQYIEDWGQSGSLGFALLRKTDTQVTFMVHKWKDGDYRTFEVTGNTMIKCDENGDDTSTIYYMYDDYGLYEPTQGPEGYNDYVTSIAYLTLIHPVSSFDVLDSIIPGVTYDGSGVTYNGNRTDIVVTVTPRGGETAILGSSATYSDFCFMSNDEFNAWASAATESNADTGAKVQLGGDWNRVGFFCYNENGERIGETQYGYQNGFPIPKGTAYIELSFRYVKVA
jgi:hypothetical protein